MLTVEMIETLRAYNAWMRQGDSVSTPDPKAMKAAMYEVLAAIPCTGDGVPINDTLEVWFTDDEEFVRHGVVNFWNNGLVCVSDSKTGEEFGLYFNQVFTAIEALEEAARKAGSTL